MKLSIVMLCWNDLKSLGLADRTARTVLNRTRLFDGMKKRLRAQAAKGAVA